MASIFYSHQSWKKTGLPCDVAISSLPCIEEHHVIAYSRDALGFNEGNSERVVCLYVQRRVVSA